MSDTVCPDAGTWPDVDVVMPIRNEADHLDAAIASVRDQQYPGRLRIVLGVGPSDDGTEALAERIAESADDVVVVDNPSGRTPSALNAAIRAGRAPIVVRVDGHSQLSDGYIEHAVTVLRETGAANVGGRQVPVPTTDFERAVADATTSWMGTGGASYRTGATARATDTVYLGVFDRSAIESVGLFDEHLIRNQDYELNIRLREAGHTVWFDPELWVGYRPRGSWRSLTRQYFEYGRWKAEVLRMHPSSLRLRQMIPPLAVGAITVGAVIGTRWRSAWLAPIGYVGALLAAARGRLRTAGVLGAIHGTWAAGMAVGLADPLRTDANDDVSAERTPR